MKKYSNKLWIVVAALIAVLAASVIWQINRDSDTDKEKKSQESQSNCRVIEDRQVCDSSYIGLTESQALDKATADGLTARVVEREGESLPADLSLQPDRLNFFVSEGAVTKVEFY